MKSYSPSNLLAVSSLVSLASAQNVIQMQIVKNREVESYHLSKRSTVMTQLGNDIALYYANVTVGTPPQSLALQLDTGSSDVWVPSSSATQCTSTSEGGCPGGSFDSSKSSTYNVVGQDEFNISYVDGTGSTGDYFEDTFTIGGATLENFEMGLATQTTINQGIAGIAYSNSEAIVVFEGLSQYPNLVESMVNASLIPTEAYSLWLDDAQATTGSLLFGGIDTGKFTGPLTSLQIYLDDESNSTVPTSFTVAFTGLSATSPTGTDTLTSSDFAEPVIFDSGTSLTLLPDDLAKTVFLELGATYDSSLEEAIVPCNLGNINGTLNFSFGGSGGATIKVPVSQLIYEPLTDDSGAQETYDNGNTACILGIQPAGDRPILFGDTFLRSAYVVYDLANNRIGIAQTDFDSSKSNIVQFASQGASIPSATTAPNEPGITQTATGIVGNGATSTGSAASSSISEGATGTGVAVAGFASATNKGASKPTSKSAAGVTAPPPLASWASFGVVSMVAAMGFGGGLLVWL